MKKLFIGMIIGAVITCGVFYFINKNREDEQKENVSALVDLIKQNQAANAKMNEAINNGTATLAVHSALTVIVNTSNEYYYYRDKDCDKIEKVKPDSISGILAEEIKRQKPEDLMIIIKMMQGTDIQHSIGLLDAIGRAGIQPGHYAEVDLSEAEKNCIKNYQKN